MRNGRLGRLLVNLRAALVCALFVVASLPQLAGAHARAGTAMQAPQSLYQVATPHSEQFGGASGHCQLGQECSALGILAGRIEAPQKALVARSRYLFPQTPMTSRPISFDPPPPRRHL
jgi:hypothetical protein